jgi:hypothetical protein
MLSKILQEFRNSKGAVNLNELCRVLNVERSALDGMISMLVRQGKLKQVSVQIPTCGNCAGCHGCAIDQDSTSQGKTWELVVSPSDLS